MKLITLNRIIYYNLPKTIIYIPLSFKVNEEKVRCSLRDRLIGTYPTDICPNISAMLQNDFGLNDICTFIVPILVVIMLSQHLAKNCDKMYCLNFATQSINVKPTFQHWTRHGPMFFLYISNFSLIFSVLCLSISGI